MYLNIYILFTNSIHNLRLTLTWDVFKYIEWKGHSDSLFGLTLTWDVFKLT